MPAADLTVVLLNWARPQNVIRYIEAYGAMPRVARVVVFDNALHGIPLAMPPDPAWTLADHVGALLDPRYVFVSSSTDLGLPTRFAAAGLARTPLVMLADDDIDVPAATVDALADPVRDGDACLAGLFGRRPLPDGTYVLGEHYGRVEAVLTRALVTTRRACCAALCPAMRMAEQLGGEPFGNGEDIVLSYAARRAHPGLPCVALDLPYANRDFDSPCSISVRFAGHLAHRTGVVRWCRDEFGSATADSRC